MPASSEDTLGHASKAQNSSSSSSSVSSSRFALDAAAAVLLRLRQLLARVPPVLDVVQTNTQEHRVQQQQQQWVKAQHPALHTSARPVGRMPEGAASAAAGSAAGGEPLSACRSTPVACTRSTGLANTAVHQQQQQQQPLLPGWSLVRLERHAAVAGNSGSGVAVLDARPEPWREAAGDGGLSELLASLRQVQLDGPS
jgi:hypothetical protein